MSGNDAAGAAAAAAPASAAAAGPPVAKRVPHVRERHGRTFSDDYEWLRDKGSPEVRAHLEAENAWTDAQLADQGELRDAIVAEIRGRTQETDMSVPVRSGGWWYYSRTVEGRSYGMSCRMRADGDDWTPPEIPVDAGAEPVPGEEVMLDLDAMAEGHEFFALGAAAVTVDGNLLAYSVDVAGDERYDLRVKDLRTGELLDDEIRGVAPGATWIGGEWLFYRRIDEAWRPDSVWRHRIGADPAEDVRVFHEPDERFWTGVGTTRSERFLVVETGSKVTSETWYLDCADPTGELTCVRPREEGVEYDVDHAVVDGRDLWLVTHNLTGPNFALGACPVGPFGGVGDLEELIAHRDDRRVEGVDCFAGHIVAAYRSGGIGRLALRVLGAADDGGFHEMAFDEELYSAGTGANPEWGAPVLRYGYASYVTPQEEWQLDVATGERTLLKRKPVRGYDPADYVAERRWVTAADGAEIPVSLLHRADLDLSRPNPLVLYGYGSYEMAMDPGFSVASLSLLDRGMVFAFAHVRGGGEMGRSWWENGRGLAKRNTFTDFIAVADHLLETGWTTRRSMVALGGSAGGMLMGAVANMAPDRFAGIQAVVPFVDPLTSILMPELPLTVTEWDEWGDPYHDPEVYDYIASYAPYENIRDDVEYPAILAVTSLNDTRVLYVEPAKWVAALRARARGGPFLLRCEMSAGHGGVSGRYARWRQTAFEYAWLLRTAGAA